MTEKTELLATIERIRSERYPDLPKDLVKKIINIETDFTEDPVEAHKRISNAIDEYFNNEKGE